MEVVTKIAPIALALIMLTLGLGLTTSDFTRVIKRPKDFLVGLICQVILLPIIAFVFILAGNKLAEGKFKLSLDMFYYFFLYGFLAPLWLITALYNVFISKEPAWKQN